MEINNKKEISPIFVTGSVRSGTTVVTRALWAAGIPGYDEGRFIDFMGLFLKLVDRRYIEQSRAHREGADIMIKDVPQDIFEKDFSKWFIDQYLKYCRYNDTWVDKTPNFEFLYTLPILSELIPESKFIILKRRPIENIESRLRKFTWRGVDFEYHCQSWAEIMELILKIQKSVPKERYLIIDQYDISQNPEDVANKIGLFLNFDFNKIEKIKDTFNKTRPESTGGSEEKIKSLEETNWTDEQKEFFLKTCGPMAKEFGWSLDDKYYLS